jgi:hypothetical protein
MRGHILKVKVVVCAFALVSLSACGQPKADVPNPDEQVVRELSRSRIIMLGDFAHELPLSTQSLTSTLSIWLSMLEKGESGQNRLTLFLEEDSTIAGLVRQYLKSGDLNPLLDFLLPSTSIERLEFYADLRGITLRIDSMNRVLPSPKQIVFDVQGPEAFNVFDPMLLDSSDRVTRLFYVRERDSLSAMNVIAYLKGRPEQKALMFYGSGHLIKNTVEKGHAGPLTPSEDTGHFLAYYLKREFGDEQVFTITQTDRHHSPLEPGEFDGPDFMFLSRDVPWAKSPQKDEHLVPSNFDAFIIRNQFHMPTHPLGHVFSMRIISASIKRLEFLQRHQSGAMGSRFYKQAIRTLEFLSDTDFSTPAEWRSWYEVHRLEGLRSDRVRNRLSTDCANALGTPELPSYIDDLVGLGFDPRIGSPTMTRQEWDKCFNDMWPQIAFLNAIGVYWVGDAEEQSEARAYLIEASGESYQKPSQYLKWWRHRFFNVRY